jgi:tetratricopeptide (TPR) repeat protein
LLPERSDDLRARILGNLGVAWCSQGDLRQGGDYFEGALEIFRKLQDHWGEAGALHNLGMIEEYTGDWAAAAAAYQQALDLAEKLGDIERQTELESSLGILQTKRGDYDDAVVHLTQFLELAGSHLKEQMIYAYPALADLWIRRGELEEAEASLDEAERLALEMPLKSRLPEIYRLWAELRLAQGRIQEALTFAERAVTLAGELEELDPLEKGTALRALGQALVAAGRAEPATIALEQSLQLLEDRDTYEAARTKAHWGIAVLSGGDVDQGARLLQEARATFEELGAKPDSAATARAWEAVQEGKHESA